MVVPRMRMLNGQPSLQRESPVEIRFMSNNFDSVKVHFMFLFVDITRNLRVGKYGRVFRQLKLNDPTYKAKDWFLDI